MTSGNTMEVKETKERLGLRGKDPIDNCQIGRIIDCRIPYTLPYRNAPDVCKEKVQGKTLCTR